MRGDEGLYRSRKSQGSGQLPCFGYVFALVSSSIFVRVWLFPHIIVCFFLFLALHPLPSPPLLRCLLLTCLTQLISHTTHLSQNPLSHNSSHTNPLSYTHSLTLISHNSSLTQLISHNSSLTQLISHKSSLIHSLSHTHLTQLI